MGKKNLALLSCITLSFMFALSPVALGYNGTYPSQTGVPTSKNQTPGPASTTMFGNVQNGAQIYTANCQACHGVAGAANGVYPGLGNVSDPNSNTAMDYGLYDINPAIFARDLDSMLQHGSKPSGVPAPMPAWGDTGALSQSQIADVEAYVMSLSNVKWPTLALNGTTLNGSGFTAGSTVQLYQNGTALNGTATPDSNGSITISNVNIPTGQKGNLTANYAALNVSGIASGDKSQLQLAMDGNKGAAYTVAVASYEPSVAATNMPKTGSNSIILALIGAVLAAIGGFTLFRRPRFNK